MKSEKHIVDVKLLESGSVGAARDNPYLFLYRLTLQNSYSDGTRSEPYPYDALLRKYLDAVAIILTATVDEQLCVCLRKGVRPPLLLRRKCSLPVPDKTDEPLLYELPAGLIEDSDKGESGICKRASIETLEETGYRVDADEFKLFKTAPFISPGVIPERLWYVMATVKDTSVREVPEGDGSPVEEGAVIEWVPLKKALVMCDDSRIEDMKTELGIRRLNNLLLQKV